MLKTLGGRCIYKAPNGAMVYQNFYYRWLTFESNAIQTLINRRHPEKIGLNYAHHLSFAARAQPADCCLLGLGGAGVAHFLAPYLNASTIVSIENDAEIIKLAKTYFQIDRLKNLSIIHQDANEFVQQCPTLYKHLMVDLFDAHSFPDHCNTYEFFANCQRILLPEGILAVNLANLDEQWPVFKHIRDVFHQRTVSLPVKGTANMIVLACNSSSKAPLLDLLKNSRCLKELYWNTRWGCVAQL